MTCYNSELPIGPPGPTGPQGPQGEPGVTLPYKVYTALLTQVNEDAPTAIELQNTIGNVSFNYDGIGQYNIILENAPYNKIFMLQGYNYSTPAVIGDFAFFIRPEDDNSIVIITKLSSNGNYANNILPINFPIEIRVYN